MITGDWLHLAAHELAIWRGWVIYSWEHYFAAHLFVNMPQQDELGYSFNSNPAEVNPYFLRACGIGVRFDLRGERGTQFYYGKHSDGRGNHDPIEIELTLPQPIFWLLGIDEAIPVDAPTISKQR